MLIKGVRLETHRNVFTRLGHETRAGQQSAVAADASRRPRQEFISISVPHKIQFDNLDGNSPLALRYSRKWKTCVTHAHERSKLHCANHDRGCLSREDCMLDTRSPLARRELCTRRNQVYHTYCGRTTAINNGYHCENRSIPPN